MAIIEKFVLEITSKVDDLIRGGNEVEKQKRKLNDDQKRRDKEDEKRRKKELDHNKQVKRDLLDRIKHTKDLALKITGIAGIFSAVGMAKLTDDTIKQADALQFLGKEFGMAASRVKAFQDAARLGGGTAEGMTEALSSAANDVALHRLKGKSIYEMGGGQLLAQYGGMAGVNWDEAMKDTESYLTAKMRTIAWLQKQSKETLRGVDPKQAASQLAIEAGMAGIMNPMQDYDRFKKNVEKRERKAKQWENPNVREIREDFTELQLDAETILSSIILQAFAPELAKIGKSVGDLKPEDVEKIVKKMQEFIASLDKVVTKIWDISQDKETKKFFDGIGVAADKAGEAISFVAEKTGGWGNLLTGLIGLRLLAFFGGLAGAIGLGAGVGVTGAILAAAGAVALLAGNFDKVKESSKKAIDYVGEKLGVKNAYDKSVSAVSGAIEWTAEKTGLSTTSPSNLKGGAKNRMMDVYKSFREHGMSDKQAKALTAQVGRENAYQDKYLFGYHYDAANNAQNIGMISWQGSRAEKLKRELMEKGLFKNGKMEKSKAAIDAQVEFMINELKSGQYKTGEFMQNPDLPANVASKILGKNYVKWAYGQSKLKSGAAFDWQSHLAREMGYRQQLENIFPASQAKDYEVKKTDKPQFMPRAPVIPVNYEGTEPKKTLPKPMVLDKGQYNDNTLPINKPIIAKPLPTPLPSPLPPPGATTNNQSAVNNATINNTFNIKSTEPKAVANEIKNTLDSYANFSNPVVNSFNTGFSE